jgi:hypothetical protein
MYKSKKPSSLSIPPPNKNENEEFYINESAKKTTTAYDPSTTYEPSRPSPVISYKNTNFGNPFGKSRRENQITAAKKNSSRSSRIQISGKKRKSLHKIFNLKNKRKSRKKSKKHNKK